MAISEISDIVRKTLKEESGDSDLTAALKMLVGLRKNVKNGYKQEYVNKFM